MTFKAKGAKSIVTPLLTLVGQNVKSVNHYKYLGIVLDTELSDNKDIKRQLRYQNCASNKLEPLFPDAQMQLTCTFSFLLYAHVCIANMVQFQEVLHAEIACDL